MASDLLIYGRKKPVPRTQRATLNRAKQLKRDDNIKDISVSLMDMDSAIMYYFENVIKPSVKPLKFRQCMHLPKDGLQYKIVVL